MIAHQLVASIHSLFDDLVHRYGRHELKRVEQCIQINVGQLPLPALPRYQRPSLFYFPGIGGRPWYQSTEFDALSEVAALLEASADTLRDEFLAQVTSDRLIPYAEQMAGRFSEIDRASWGSFYLRRKGELAVAENCQRCPQAAALLLSLAPYISPSGAVIFSVIQGGTKIPPHTDTTNLKLTCQLALIIPSGCRLRVGGEIRGWQEGRVLFFDDTFEHESWNESPDPRVCLLADIWHPELTSVERIALQELDALLAAHVTTAYQPPWAATAPCPDPAAGHEHNLSVEAISMAPE